MSDDGKKDNNDAGDATEPTPEQASEPESKPKPTPAPSAAPEPARRGSAVGWLALVLVLALAGGAVWLYPQLQQTETALDQRVALLEDRAGRESTDLAAMRRELEADFESGIASLDTTQRDDAARLAEALVGIEAQLSEQRAELARFGSNDRASWLLAEAEYLLRLANQRLIMAGDTEAARALLASADTVLRELDDVSLHEVRKAVAADMAAVRAVPVIDVEGLYLRLSALVEQADTLVIFTLPDEETRSDEVAADAWQDRLRQGYEDALLKLSDYIIIRRRDVPIQSLMDPQLEGLVRQNLRMLLEQAQVALLSGNGALYRQSLVRADLWLEQFMDSDPATAGAMSREIRQLADARVAIDLPDISRSLRALDAAMAARLDREEGGDR